MRGPSPAAPPGPLLLRCICRRTGAAHTLGERLCRPVLRKGSAFPGALKSKSVPILGLRLRLNRRGAASPSNQEKKGEGRKGGSFPQDRAAEPHPLLYQDPCKEQSWLYRTRRRLRRSHLQSSRPCRAPHPETMKVTFVGPGLAPARPAQGTALQSLIFKAFPQPSRARTPSFAICNLPQIVAVLK
jgi:hypothetical protein